MLHADIKMDGPSANWAFLKEIQKHHEEEELYTCWNIKGTLKAISKLLHDSLGCCADYISVR